jgi:putative DNA primase/helicase
MSEDFINNFIEAIRLGTGAAPSPEEIAPGKWVAYPISGKRGDPKGRCKLFPGGAGGMYVSSGENGVNWRLWQGCEPRTQEELAAFQAEVGKAKKEVVKQIAKQRAECRDKSAELWEKGRAVDAQHPYIVAKNIRPYGVKQLNERLMIPVRDAGGTLRGLQFIAPNGCTQFKTGTAVAGCFHIIGTPNGRLLITESWGEACALHQATGHAVAVAFNPGNLKPVAEALKAAFPEVQIVVCATDGNPEAAEARVANGFLAILDNREAKATDFNALARLAGLEAVKACIEAAAMPTASPFPDNREAKATDFNAQPRLAGLEAVKACVEGAAAMPIPCTAPEQETKAASSRIRIIDVADFLQLQLPARENILAPWLPTQGLAMVCAPRGIGTHFSLGVAYAVSCGVSFLNWQAPVPRGVLFIDGEMRAGTLQKRLARIARSSERVQEAPLRIITPDLQQSGIIDLSRPEDQAELLPFLDGISLIVVDNLSTLSRNGGRETEGETWLSLQAWALQQRLAGRSVLFIHHGGKDGAQRGISHRDDLFDTVIALRRPGGNATAKTGCFEVHFDKARGISGEGTKPVEARLVTRADGRQVWTMRALENSTADKVAALLNDGLKQNDIADLLKITKGAVSKAKNKAFHLGLLNVDS